MDNLWCRAMFQFHKGTIRTGILFFQVLASCMRFNSIKVRLELLPSLGRTKSVWFQFHKGTIRTHSCRISSLSVSSFNSIKVRLEPRRPPHRWGSVWKFQFHKGTIRTERQGSVVLLQGSFNSIKVRLERSPLTSLPCCSTVSIP